MRIFNFFDAVFLIKILFFAVQRVFRWVRIVEVEANFVLINLFALLRIMWHRFDNLSFYHNGSSSLCELECIRLQIHKNLLNSHFISFYHITNHVWFILQWETYKVSFKNDIQRISFVLLNQIDVLDGFFDIEPFNYLIKLVSFDLSITKNIFYIHEEKTTGRFLNLDTVIKFVNKILKFVIDFLV